jgi:hypothetical protein
LRKEARNVVERGRRDAVSGARISASRGARSTTTAGRPRQDSRPPRLRGDAGNLAACSADRAPTASRKRPGRDSRSPGRAGALANHLCSSCSLRFLRRQLNAHGQNAVPVPTVCNIDSPLPPFSDGRSHPAVFTANCAVDHKPHRSCVIANGPVWWPTGSRCLHMHYSCCSERADEHAASPAHQKELANRPPCRRAIRNVESG